MSEWKLVVNKTIERHIQYIYFHSMYHITRVAAVNNSQMHLWNINFMSWIQLGLDGNWKIIFMKLKKNTEPCIFQPLIIVSAHISF